MSTTRPLRVLVVDDSALVRQTLLALLTHEGFEVTIAADPLIAIERMKAADPDVILLDLEMPRMDGLSFLRKIMSEDPRPVVICSAVAQRGSENALRALDEGALDIVVKPQIGVQQFLHESAVMLADVVRAASIARPSRRIAQQTKRTPLPPRAAGPAFESAVGVIAIGASTGGTSAIRVLLEGLPAEAPPIVIVQHMPKPFTTTFAQGLDRVAAVRVREAEDGDPLLPGLALLAPGDRHMRVVRASGGARVVELFSGPLISRHRPSVDVLFSSVAECYGEDAVGVILTGMGADGAAGMLEMHNAGAFTIAQDETTSVVFGMPKEAIARGATDRVIALPSIASCIQGLMTAHGCSSST